VHSDDIYIVKNRDVVGLLSGHESEVVEAVADAYRTHAAQQSSLPHSLFLRFPEEPKNRIIALPAYLGGDFDVAGMKWIASFPDNIEKGLERASAVVVLNSPETGRPYAFIEGSSISAKRTAASAALAARALQNGHSVKAASLLGCGIINFEIARFLLNTCPGIERFTLYDVDPARAEQLKQRCSETFEGIEVEVAPDAETALGSAPVVSLATTAITPHIADLSACVPDATVLHVSLRDLTAEAILACDNVVDDIDHVCRAQTSIHLAEQLSGERDFIRCTLADVLTGAATPRRGDGSITVFSPFGLGILDLALAKVVYEYAVEQGLGEVINSFLPESWGGEGQVA
jgi:N-[(2S)-2-amino-2-carboxyethyl]-L-glutamate dehydrogenase